MSSVNGIISLGRFHLLRYTRGYSKAQGSLLRKARLEPGWLEMDTMCKAAHYLIGVIVARGTYCDAPKATTGNGCCQAQEPVLCSAIAISI